MKTDGTQFTILHSFAGHPSDGAHPRSSLFLDDHGALYGTTYEGGEHDLGSVFSIKVDGSEFAVLHAFEGAPVDGAHPYASVVRDASGKIFGTTREGGYWNGGTIFRMKSDGSEFTLLHSFFGDEGYYPYAPLVLDRSGNLFGTAAFGSTTGNGTIFTLRTNGKGFKVLHPFTGLDDGLPFAGLVLDGSGTLFGATLALHNFGGGATYSVKTDGTGYAVLHEFGHPSEGDSPVSSLVMDGTGNLFGTTQGDLTGLGTVFRLKTDGTGFATLHAFSGPGNTSDASLFLDVTGNLYGTTPGHDIYSGGTIFTLTTDGGGYRVVHSFAGDDSDGAFPYASLIHDQAGNLYGTTSYGGSSGLGSVFKTKSDGTQFVLLHSFTGGDTDGAYPFTSLVVDDAGHLFGSTTGGGSSDFGTLFTLQTDGGGFVLLHSFSRDASNGAEPSSIILDGLGSVFGTANYGGLADRGIVFRVRIDGLGFTILRAFSGGSSDGAYPVSVSLDGSGNLFGATRGGGGSDRGTVFEMNTDGSGFRLLHSFAGLPVDGAQPNALLVGRSGDLFGTTSGGGPTGNGTVFALRTAGGIEYRLLHVFPESGAEGRFPLASLTEDTYGNLFGTTAGLSAVHLGTVFKVRTDGTGFTLLHTFADGASDGVYPYGTLALDESGHLFGTTSYGGAWNEGVEFRLAARPGDANNDGSIDVRDVLYLINALFSGGAQPFAGGDVNGDGLIDVNDVFALIGYLYAGGPAPTN